MGAWVRQRQSRGLAAQLLVLGSEADEVDVEGARSPPEFARAPAGDFDPLRHREQFECRQRGGHEHSEVEEVVLFDSAPRCGAEE